MRPLLKGLFPQHGSCVRTPATNVWDQIVLQDSLFLIPPAAPPRRAVAPKQCSADGELRLVAGNRNAVSLLGVASAFVSTWQEKWGGRSEGMWELVVFALAGYLKYGFISSNFLLCCKHLDLLLIVGW